VIELFGDGRQRRDLNHIDDVIEALLLAVPTKRLREKYSISGR
jgi:nucleoside-diphosphate-sugar epimerase